ncbi:MAG: DUF3899 domain-containing protein [Acholeplasmataceae bacterium]
MKKFFKDHLQYILRSLLTAVIMFVLSILVLWSLYGFEMRLDYISNSIFIVNSISFAVALVMQTGATRLYIGFNYTLKTFFQYKQMKQDYKSMQDYYDEKAPGHKKNVSFVLVVTVLYLVVALILSEIYMGQIS